MKKLLLVLIGMAFVPGVAFAGSQAFTTAGTHTFIVPPYTTLTVHVWGGGGGGAGVNGYYPGAAGGASSFDGVGAYGGGGAIPSYSYMCGAAETGGSGGTGYGGSVSGGGGGQSTQLCYSASGGNGGNSPNGGAGGPGAVCTGAQTISYPGGNPGGGGGGTTRDGGEGYPCGPPNSESGPGGGAGGYSTRTYSAGQLAVGSAITVVVGDGGGGGIGSPNGYVPPGGTGGHGRVGIAWTDPPPLPTATITSSLGSSIRVGQSSVINLAATPGSGDIVQYTLINEAANGGGQFNAAEAAGPNDAFTFTPSAAGTYTFYGYVYTATYPTWTDAANITVTVSPSPAPTCAVTLSPSIVNAGQGSTLSYSSTNASWVYINSVGYVSPNTSGSLFVAPGATTNYSCTAANPQGTQSSTAASLTVNQPPTCKLSASPSTIAKGGSSTLSYSSTNASSFTISPVVGSVPVNTSGSRSVSPTVTTTYTGSVTGPGGSASCTVPTLPAGSTKTVTIACAPSSSSSCTGLDGQTVTTTSIDASCNVTTSSLPACRAPGVCQDNFNSCQYPQPAAQSFTYTPPGGGAAGTQSGNLSINPNIVASGKTTQVYWDISNVLSCTITGANGDGTGSNSTGTWSTTSSGTTGVTTSPITSQTVYTLKCLEEDGVTYFTQTATVNVVPTYQER
jgi:hypothetical protein